MISNRLLLPILVLVVLGSPTMAPAAHETGFFEKQAPKGADYSLLVPDSYDRRSGATAILLLHGAGDNHKNFMSAWKNNRFKADWIAVVPNAKARGAWDAPDIDPVMDVIDEVSNDYNLRRIFVGGFSRGGYFSYTLGLTYPDRFSGILCLAGGLANPGLAKPALAEKIAVAIVHGESDSIVPFAQGKDAHGRFEKAGWKHLFFKPVPGLGHRIDSAATKEAFDWLDENAQPLRTPRDYYEYAMNRLTQADYAQAYWALNEIDKEENEGEKFYAQIGRQKKKIEKKSASAGKKILKAIEGDKNARWLEDWRNYDQSFQGTPFHADVSAARDALKARHEESATTLYERAAAAHESQDYKAAIATCLEIRDACYLAEGEGVTQAKALLAGYRADPDVRKKHRAQLKGTEHWG